MDGPQMDAYYEDQLYVLQRAIEDLGTVNWNGLHHWTSAKATWTDPPIRPDRLAIIREHAKTLYEASSQESSPS